MSHRLCIANHCISTKCSFIAEEGSNHCSLHKDQIVTCSICLNDINLKPDDLFLFNKNMGHKLPCEHIFHYKCIKRWIEKNDTCPYCRSIIDNEDPLIMEKQKQELQGARYIDRLLTNPRNNTEVS